MSTNNGPTYLYRNAGGYRNQWLYIQLVGAIESGAKQSIGKVDADQFLMIDESRGVIAREPPAR